MSSESRSIAVPPASDARARSLAWHPSQEQIILLVTVFLLIVFGLTLRGFATTANLLNLVRSVSILGILGLGMAVFSHKQVGSSTGHISLSKSRARPW